MLLRASSEVAQAPADLRAINDDAHAAASGVPAAAALLAFGEAVVGGDEEALARARRALLDEVGPEAAVDAAAVAGNFERMVRIADGTGIPLDTPVNWISVELRETLGIDAFGAAENTPSPGLLGRLAGRALGHVFVPAMKLIGRSYRRR